MLTKILSADAASFFKPLEDRMNIEFIRYAVQKQMFCPKTNDILDYRTAIMMEVYKEEKLIASQVFSPTLVNDLLAIKNNLETRLPGMVVLFMTANKQLTNELLTIIK